jgi:hypothetical protein
MIETLREHKFITATTALALAGMALVGTATEIAPENTTLHPSMHQEVGTTTSPPSTPETPPAPPASPSHCPVPSKM